MDQILRLFDAARRGDVPELQQLLNIDPQILERVVSSTIYTETPLHVAALADQTDFARALITRMPSLTMEKNQEGLIPLHIASARGHLNMVRELLRHDSNHEQCLVKGRGGRIPLHDAVIKGRDSVIEDLISHFAESLTEVTERGETVLHLAAMNYQSRALEVLIERMKRLENFSAIFNAKDKGGNTFWDLGHHRQTRENDNEESGKNSGLQNAMQIVAGLILTATYQACVSPPSTIWKEGRKLDLRCMFKGNLDMELPLNTCPAASFYWFMLFNTAGFVSAFIIIILPISPGRKIVRRKAPLFIVLILSLIANYFILIANLSSNPISAIILILLSGFLFLLLSFFPAILLLLACLLVTCGSILAKMISTIIEAIMAQWAR